MTATKASGGRHLPRLMLPAMLIACSWSAASADDPAGDAFFEKRIRPVLVDNCYECHSANAEPVEANLRLDVAEGLLQGGDSGPVIEPDDPEASLLLAALRQEGPEMPPDGPLADSVIADFEAWIRMGAPDPRDGEVEPLEHDAEGRLWSLEPIDDPSAPEVEDEAWPRTTIDRFVLARLEERGLYPVRDADRWTLVRRLYFDLTGLPPTPEQAEAFVADDSPDALEQLVDRLLASPQFGEKWARHWLDVARYAESSGREFNFTYPHAWPYRDYVIDALNSDKPYDAFVREQIAGDLIAAEEEADWQRRDELHAATGFLAVGPKRHNAGGRIFTADRVDDQIDTLGQAVLGLTVACARCHDHKFDPIPTEDYYALAGIFQSTRVRDGTIEQQYSRHPTQAIPLGRDGRELHEAAETHAAELQALNEELEAKQEELEEAQQAVEDEDDGESESDAEEGGEPEAEAEDEEGDAAEAEARERVSELEERVAELEAAIEQHEAEAPPRPAYTMGVEEKEPERAHIAIGGDPRDRGDRVARGFLSAIEIDDAPTPPDDASGRMELGRWITSRRNPLTARVIVNRVWSHLFGRGIVSTVDNFGALGESPSHPDLLDHLAHRFMEEGWSIKQLVRRMVLSRTYALSSAAESSLYAEDPENVYLWRMSPRRLQVEQLRDAMLAVSGQLDRSPASGSAITQLGSQLARQIDQEKMTPPNTHRSVYQPVVRDYLPEVFQLFDFAAPSLVIGRRAETTVPAQALYLLNSDFALDQAEHAARRLLDEELDDEQRVERAYRLMLTRPAIEEERAEALAFVQAGPREDDEAELRAWTALCQALIVSSEFRYLMDAPRPR